MADDWPHTPRDLRPGDVFIRAADGNPQVRRTAGDVRQLSRSTAVRKPSGDVWDHFSSDEQIRIIQGRGSR